LFSFQQREISTISSNSSLELDWGVEIQNGMNLNTRAGKKMIGGLFNIAIIGLRDFKNKLQKNVM
jgi:hypothetical protein